ncbi:MAG: hypothetical protein PSV36_10575 [Algoriphagus sp.]|nr:hypothetical protein [Algoriphagus sp.]
MTQLRNEFATSMVGFFRRAFSQTTRQSFAFIFKVREVGRQEVGGWKAGSWRQEVGSWKAGSWKLEVGRQEVGSWKAGSWRLEVGMQEVGRLEVGGYCFISIRHGGQVSVISKSYIRNQKSEIKNPKSQIPLPLWKWSQF